MAKRAEHCEAMLEVRQGVDAIDRQLVELLARRFGYMRAAARIKQNRSAVRDEARKTSVIAAATAKAKELGLPEDVIANIWEILVEGSIAYEFEVWDDLRIEK